MKQYLNNIHFFLIIDTLKEGRISRFYIINVFLYYGKI